MKRNLYLSIILSLGLGLGACVPSGPVDFKAGEFQCEHCHMSIVDLRFRSQIITKKGRVKRFDSLECMESHRQSGEQNYSAVYVADYSAPSKWVELKQAKFLQSEKLRSPMGAGLSAYATSKGLQEASGVYGGREISRAELKQYVKTWSARFSGSRSGGKR